MLGSVLNRLYTGRDRRSDANAGASGSVACLPHVYEIELPEVDGGRGTEEPGEQRLGDVEEARVEEMLEVCDLRAGLEVKSQLPPTLGIAERERFLTVFG